jgi:hypothetical protein
MLEVAKDITLKLLGFLVPRLLGWFYKRSWIADRIKIRVSSEGDGVVVNGGRDLPNLRITMQVTNLSPFSIELDRVITQVALRGGVLGEFVHLRHVALKPATETMFEIHGPLSQHQLDYLDRQPDRPDATLYLCAFVNCKVHNFQLDRQITAGNVRYINFPPRGGQVS